MNKKDNLKTVKEKKEITVNKIFIFFTIFFLANLFINIVLAAASGGDSWKEILFHKRQSTDLFMDFYNSIRDGGSNNVYSERNNIYPPLCVLIFRFFSKLINPDLVSTGFSQRTTLQSDTLCTMIYFIFALVCVLSMVRLINSYINITNGKEFKMQATVISFLMIVSHPIMFCLERGNILILSLVMSMFFLFFRNSENKLIKELSYISLAVAAGIKLYPAIFGLILLTEKKYKDALRLIAYGIIIVVFPIIFFLDEFMPKSAMIGQNVTGYLSISSAIMADEGSKSIFAKLIENLLSFAIYKKTSLNLSSVSVQNLVFMVSENPIIAKAVCAVTEAAAFIVLFYTKKEWQKVFLLTYLMLNIPSASNSYALSFMIIPFIIFMFGKDSKKFTGKDIIYTVCFSLLLTPLPSLFYYHQDLLVKINESIGLYSNSVINQNIGTFVFQFLFVFAIVDIVLTLRKNKTKKNKTDIPEITEEAAQA